MDPWVGKIPYSRKWQPAPVFLPGNFHGQRSLVGYSPSGCKELDTTEQLNTQHMTIFCTWALPSVLKPLHLSSQAHSAGHSQVFRVCSLSHALTLGFASVWEVSISSSRTRSGFISEGRAGIPPDRHFHSGLSHAAVLPCLYDSC